MPNSIIGNNYGSFTQPPNQVSDNIITVDFIQGNSVNNYPISPGRTVLLIDYDAKKFWIKERNQNGMYEPLREFDFTEKTLQQTNDIDSAKFVTKDEFNELKSVIESIKPILEDLKG